MANINTLLKELDLPSNWKRIESPTFYNGDVIPFDQEPPKSGGLILIENGNIIVRNPDNTIIWSNMTIYNEKHAKNFEARFRSDGQCRNFDINYFSMGTEKNVVDNPYMNKAIKETVQCIRKNKEQRTFSSDRINFPDLSGKY